MRLANDVRHLRIVSRWFSLDSTVWMRAGPWMGPTQTGGVRAVESHVITRYNAWVRNQRNTNCPNGRQALGPTNACMREYKWSRVSRSEREAASGPAFRRPPSDRGGPTARPKPATTQAECSVADVHHGVAELAEARGVLHGLGEEVSRVLERGSHKPVGLRESRVWRSAP